LALVLGGATVALADPPTSTSGTVNQKLGLDVGDPISANAGALHFTVPLLDLGGPLPLTYSLSYRMDQFASRTLKTDFQANVDIEIEMLSNRYLQLYLRNGESLIFRKPGNSWELDPPSVILYSLKETGADECNGYFYLQDPIGELIYIFAKTTATCPHPTSYRKLLAIMDRNGNRLDYTYNSVAFPLRPDQISDGLGRSLTFTYQAGTEKIAQVSDQCGRTVQINQPSGYVQSTTDAMGQTTIYHLVSNGGINREFPKGNIPYTITVETRNQDGIPGPRVTTQTDAYGNTTNLTYASTSTLVTETRPDGTKVEYRHAPNNDNNGPPSSVVDPTGATSDMGITALNQISSITDRMGDTTTMTYHAQTGKLASYTDAEGHTTTYTYTAENQTFTNPINSETVTFTFYNLTRVDYADGTFETFTYDTTHHNGNLLSRTDRAGKVWTYTYNNRGQVLTATNPLGGVTTYTYNADATIASRTDPETGTTTYQYDACKRLNRITHPDASFFQMAYDANDHLTSATDERGNTFNYTYDANGNLIRVTDPKGNMSQYNYDLMDRMTTYTDRKGKVSTITYDAMGRLASTTDPDNIALTYGYDARGWLNQTTLGSRTWQTGYDNEGVPASTTTPLGSATTYGTNKLGQTTGMTDALGNHVNIARDALQRITGITDPLGHTTAFTYNNWDGLSSVTMPVIGTATYQRNNMGQLTRIIDQNAQNWDFIYSNMGRVVRNSDPLGNTWRYTYNNSGFIGQITFPEGGNVALSYDNAGNQIQRAYSGGLTLNYTYDNNLNRLAGTDQIEFTYDEEGNIISTNNHGTPFGATFDNGGGDEFLRPFQEQYNKASKEKSVTYSTAKYLLHFRQVIRFFEETLDIHIQETAGQFFDVVAA
jgi:YD repeat-containing protein